MSNRPAFLLPSITEPNKGTRLFWRTSLYQWQEAEVLHWESETTAYVKFSTGQVCVAHAFTPNTP